MQNNDFTTSFTVSQSAAVAFDAINNVTAWWTENLEGETRKLNDVFEVRFGDVHYSKQQLVELINGKKIVWLITDSKLNFTKDLSEWTGTKIEFDITEKEGGTEVRFTHKGITNLQECYDACSNAWSQYIQQSLLPLISIGAGHPTRKEM